MYGLSHLSQYCAKSRHNFVSIIMTPEKETKKLQIENSLARKNVALLLCPIYVAFCVQTIVIQTFKMILWGMI